MMDLPNSACSGVDFCPLGREGEGGRGLVEQNIVKEEQRQGQREKKQEQG